jgi:hypothetical protein
LFAAAAMNNIQQNNRLYAVYLVEIYGNFEGTRCIHYQNRIISQKLLAAVTRQNLQNKHFEFSSLWQQRLATETLNSSQMYGITHA